MEQQITRETLEQILQVEDVETLAFAELVRLFREEEGSKGFLPDGVSRVDPRAGDRVLFSSSRARRPHDNRPPSSGHLGASPACVVCQGHVTGVIDVAELSEGFTFINKNLYPSLYPFDVPSSSPPANAKDRGPSSGRASYGLHLLQWTSSLHDRDWHNMPLADCVVVMQRLAALERKLLAGVQEFWPAAQPREEQIGARGFVSIIKNYGRLVGGSLVHGHQQIGLSNAMPRRVRDNWRFKRERGVTFASYLLRENPAELLIRDYGPAVLLVPYFMRRPYDMMLLVKDTGKQHLYELTEDEVGAVAEGWHGALRAIRRLMPELGREIAYNVVTHNGPGGSLYFEFLPYTQETGGFEHLGLWICHADPKRVAIRVRQVLGL
jgi:galactose-1-phosphate uridylyltransferase